MFKGLPVCIVLVACGVCRGGLLTDFAASYALYQQCTMSNADFDLDGDVDGSDFLNWQRGISQAGQFINVYGDADLNGVVNQADLDYWMGQYAAPPEASESVCFKLYLDPEGILNGSVTMVLDVPNPAPGIQRLAFPQDLPTVIDVHPEYAVRVDDIEFIQLPNRERIEARAFFNAKDPTNLPAGPVTIFGFQVMDNLPQFGLDGAIAEFDFRADDFVTVFDPDTGDFATFNHDQLVDVPLKVMQPLVLDVNVLTGGVSIRNPSEQQLVAINFYEIKSLSGSLNPTAWTSFDDAENDPPGIGWEEAGGASANVLAESNLLGALAIEPNNPRALGPAFDRFKGFRDLTFFYTTPQGSLIPGEINYNFTSLAEPLPEPPFIGAGLLFVVGWAARRRNLLRVVA